ncbi:hypothetical protein L7F22_035461 [Adiantum nelumboides]|nr:hypothetical protein [Adiantum nelumboides]
MASATKMASLRWQLLRRHLLPKADHCDDQELIQVSRRPRGRFGLVMIERLPLCEVEEDEWPNKELRSIVVKYQVPVNPVVDLVLIQRKENGACLSDFAYAKENQIDMTGLVGLWPAEEVLTHFCACNPSLFRNKRVLELGSGYGLGGLAIAACTEATEVVLTDGNPQIIEYVKVNIRRNVQVFGTTEVKAHLLNWGDNLPSTFVHSFDIVIAADCTFFRESHLALACSVKGLLKNSGDSQALLFNPQRDGSLHAFLQIARDLRLSVDLKEQYNASVWSIHESLMKGETQRWCNYDMDHCYPLLAVLTHVDLDGIQGEN